MHFYTTLVVLLLAVFGVWAQELNVETEVKTENEPVAIQRPTSTGHGFKFNANTESRKVGLQILDGLMKKHLGLVKANETKSEDTDEEKREKRHYGSYGGYGVLFQESRVDSKPIGSKLREKRGFLDLFFPPIQEIVVEHHYIYIWAQGLNVETEVKTENEPVAIQRPISTGHGFKFNANTESRKVGLQILDGLMKKHLGLVKANETKSEDTDEEKREKRYYGVLFQESRVDSKPIGSKLREKRGFLDLFFPPIQEIVVEHHVPYYPPDYVVEELDKKCIILLIVLFIDVETIEVKSEESSKVSNSDPTKLDLLEALFYPIFKRTTVEEERAPVFKNVLPMLTTIAEQNQNLKNQQNFLDNQRKKRSIGLPIRPLSPVAKGNHLIREIRMTAMATLLVKQLTILLWKSWITRRRHWISTIFEILTPLVLSFLIAYIYAKTQQLTQNMTSSLEAQGIDLSNMTSQSVSVRDIPPVIFKYPTIDVIFNNRLNFEGHIIYGPTSATTDALMRRVQDYSPYSLRISGLATEELVNAKMESFVSNETIDTNLLRSTYGLIFDENSLRNNRLNYTLRMFGEMAFIVNIVFPNKFFPGPAADLKPYTEHFGPLQILINQAFVSQLTQSGAKKIDIKRVQTFKYPFPGFKSTGDESQLFSLQDLIAATIAIGYVVMCPLIVKRITDEKVAKAKEMMRMIGMSDWVFWSSHFISYFLIMVFQSVMFTIFYCAGFGGDPVISYTSGSLFFAILFIYSIQSILFCMTITTIFNRPVLAVIVTVILWIVTYAVPIGILNPFFHKNMDIIGTNSARMLSSLLPNMGLSWCMSIMGQFEVMGTGANWSTLFRNTSVYNSLTLALVMCIMSLSCLMYGVLIWYLDNVWPFQYGVPKPVCFPFYMSYWFPSKYRDFDEKPEAKSDLVIDTRNFEREPEAPVSVRIKNLHKEFGGYGTQHKTAVDNMSLNIYGRQITALLGHNGAGKTTTMNMITGIFPPSAGTVHVDGYNIQTETNKARRSIGLCPQENVIFNELTVGQHLKLYAVLKGCDWDSVDLEVKQTLEMLKLTDKLHAMAESLSGGMKRKLSLGIAIVGGTRILILDEPTSGMDPEARRVVWDLLQYLRCERTILLTTHYMEEADVLGDRIAIMCEGRVKCCGSPMFLKKRFGAGYHLRVCKGLNFKPTLIGQTLQKYLPKAQLHSEIQSEVIYSLESNDRNTSENSTQVFPQLFDEIETNKEKLGIASCGLTITTMEDVFLRVGNDDVEGIDTDMMNSRTKLKDKSSDSLLHKSANHLTGNELLYNRFTGLLMKRFHYSKRYWPMMCFQLLVPAFLFVIALLTDYGIRNSITGQSKNLDLNLKQMYGKTFGFFQSFAYPDFGPVYQSNGNNDDLNTTILGPYEEPNKWALRYADNLEEYSHHYLTGATVEGNTASIWYNNEAIHSLSIAIDLFFESLLKYLLPDVRDNISITVRNHPLSYSENTVSFTAVIFGWAVTCLMLTPITVPFIGASYVLFPINERISKAKLLQLMTGLSAPLFWFSNLAFDLLNHSLVVIIIYIIFAIFDFNHIFFAQSNTAIGLFLMLFLFGFASIPLAYCFSLLLNKPSTGFAVLVILYLLFGVMSISAMGVLDLIVNVMKMNIISSVKFNTILSFFRLIPVFSMSFGIQKLYRIGSFAQICKEYESKNMTLLCSFIDRKSILYGCCIDKCSPTNECYSNQNPLSFDHNGVGQEFVYLVASGLFFMAILLLFEVQWMRKLWYRIRESRVRSSNNGIAMVSVNNEYQSNEDSDVVAEKYRIEGLNDRRNLSEEALAVINLSKNFGSFKAVDNLTFGIHKEECFGLLGVNGAGKTTTFSMLTGDLMVSNGNAFIDNYTLREDLKAFQQQIGYCPQFDALLEKLTGKEMLYLFARLRGVPSNKIDGEVQALIKMVDLQNHAHKCTETYSGGNRRKLSLALAIVGTPPVIFLDEPTAGVDPTARRKIWSTLVYIQEKYQSAIVLTSHSMEECEALCSRIAIMANGKFKCLGPTQHLRRKFGQGFTIVIKLSRELNDDSNYVVEVQQYIQKAFPSAVLKDSHQCLLHYHITDTSVQWSQLFAVMETAKGRLQLEDYLVSDTTLEQIFLAFAKTQR
ncbi:unnamed protein product [Oppiella nova]|uniref:ABC transporter domain-containing protein n=1 Tax=Oppiella nova TaxID=334625 RepID=A0A7R9QAM6_9ACAR|nr:unnamed protein product [Oppiella nova]CAG2161807.1 unnamed protein product [Oppiella nova]